MAFKSYITYQEYEDLGGTVSTGAFLVLERKAQRWLDVCTHNRIKYLTTIPDTVKEVLVEFINRMDEYEKQKTNGPVVEQYSNGVESISYKTTSERELQSTLAAIAVDWLPDFLVTGSVSFDAEQYIQSNYNNS